VEKDSGSSCRGENLSFFQEGGGGGKGVGEKRRRLVKSWKPRRDQ